MLVVVLSPDQKLQFECSRLHPYEEQKENSGPVGEWALGLVHSGPIDGLERDWTKAKRCKVGLIDCWTEPHVPIAWAEAHWDIS